MVRCQSARLVLRELDERDVPALHGLFGDPLTLQHWPFTMSEEEVRAMVQRARASYAETGLGLWGLELRETGALAGSAGLRRTNRADELELLWHLRREHWGKGYATEAARALVELGRGLGASRFIAPILPGNAPSARVAQRLGMRLEGKTMRHKWEHDLWALE
jgi:RimJ/RimL family protein N-acetyltransferase